MERAKSADAVILARVLLREELPEFGFRYLLEVEEVWKGGVPERLELSFFPTPWSDPPFLEEGNTHVIYLLEDPDDGELETGSCWIVGPDDAHELDRIYGEGCTLARNRPSGVLPLLLVLALVRRRTSSC